MCARVGCGARAGTLFSPSGEVLFKWTDGGGGKAGGKGAAGSGGVAQQQEQQQQQQQQAPLDVALDSHLGVRFSRRARQLQVRPAPHSRRMLCCAGGGWNAG